MNREPLPVDPFLVSIRERLRTSRALVLTAAPGAGKTTRVPPALAADGRVILLQPRRVAARAIAARIAHECGWTLGREVGWQIRFDRRFSADTRLLVVTEGILTARLQSDPLLSDFHTVVLDEFHERSIHADVAIALAKQAWRARDDLRLVVMSATIDTSSVSDFLDGCPVVDVPGRLYPIEVSYAPAESISDAVVRVSRSSTGDILCFLPGALEIRRAIDEVSGRAGRERELVPLHGSLDADEQDRAITRGSRPRVVFATNIAETSLTVPGVTTVIDSGLQKVARYDAERGIDALELERITLDAADQRAGRAGREGPGAAVRLWDPRDRLRPHREPDVRRVDLSSAILDVVAWGAEPREFEWFERPPDDRLNAALDLLERLGVLSGGRLTEVGERIQRMPLHPRLARILVEGRGALELVRACAIIGERHFLPPRTAATTSDLISALDRWNDLPPHVHRLAREIERGWSPEAPPPKIGSDSAFRRAILAGYPDRVAQRRAPRSPRLLLASGAGATLGSESGVFEGEFLVAIDVQATSTDARVRLASLIDREWLQPTRSDVEHRFDPDSGSVKAVRVDRYDAVVLAERPTIPDATVAADLLAEAWRRRGPLDHETQLLRRLRFAGHAADVDALVDAAARNVRSLAQIDLATTVPALLRQSLDRDAPESLRIPSGRTVTLEYLEDGSVSAAAKLQELFGLAETPRVGKRREPVVLSLLAPNGRPVQVTRDLKSFWDRTYPEVRRELRGRYPRHPWPEDPWNALPTSRVKGARPRH